MPTHDAAPPATHLERLATLLLVLVALLQVASFAWAVPGNDYARDLFAASLIADGEALPLRGPVVNAMVHLGPVWQYLLALPIALGLGVTGTTLLVGALAMMKLPMAWRLGHQLGGHPLARSFAALMLLPGWGLMHALQLTHTVMLEALFLASLLPLLALWRDGRATGWLLFGALAGLALHAHPVALFLALPACAVALRRRARWRGDLAMIAVGLALALLPALPAFVAEWRDGFPALVSLSEYVQAPRSGPPFAAAVASLVRGQLAGGIVLVQGVAGLTWPIAGLFAIVGIAAASGLPALLRARSSRRRWLTVLMLLLAGLLWLVLLRANVSFYMAALVWPLWMLAVAMPLAATAGSAGAVRLGYLIGIAATLLLGAIGSVAMIRQAHAGHARLPLSAFQNVGAEQGEGVPLALMPIWAFDASARRACDTRTLFVHGELAALVDFYQGLPFQLACGEHTQVQLMGARTGTGLRHWAGTSPHTLRLLGWRDAGWREALALAPMRVIHPAGPLALATSARYPHRRVDDGPVAVHRLAFSAGGDEAVAVYAPLFAFDAGAVLGATVDGVSVTPASITNSGALFLPPAGAASEHAWVIEFSTRQREQMDVVTLPLRSR